MHSLSIPRCGCDILIPAHQHLVPAGHRVVRQLRVEILVEIDHHLRDAPLRGRHRAVILPKAELAAQRDAGHLKRLAALPTKP